MNIHEKNWYGDYYRQTDDKDFILTHFIRDFIKNSSFRYMYYFRKANCKSITRFAYRVLLYHLSRKNGIEIGKDARIGKGFRIVHPYNITISSKAVIGDNVNILKGATIGVSSGKKRGAPKIGNCVQIGINSTIIGGIIIGDDVMIAPNTFVNKDIPSHSIVVGNPCVIIPRADATSEYIYNLV